MKYKTPEGGGGGIGPACGRNPNTHTELSDSIPDGPHAHLMGMTGDAGIQGDAKVTEKGQSFHFK